MALAACAIVGCDSAAAGGAADVAPTFDLATDVGAPSGTGPASQCGAVTNGEWVSGGAESPDDDSFEFEWNGTEGLLRIEVIEPGGRTGESFLLALVTHSARDPALTLNADQRTVAVAANGTAAGGVSGTVFKRINNAWGGTDPVGQVCFDAPPAVGAPLTGSYVFVVKVGEAEALHRVQGSFSLPATAVQRVTPTTLVIKADRTATVTVD